MRTETNGAEEAAAMEEARYARTRREERAEAAPTKKEPYLQR